MRPATSALAAGGSPPRHAASAPSTGGTASPAGGSGGGDAAAEGDALRCAALTSPAGGALLLTPAALRCVAADGSLMWELPWPRLLLVQQVRARVRLLVLRAHGSTSSFGGGFGGSVTEAYDVGLPSDDDAARLHEVLRLAALNAKGAALPLAPRAPLVRTTLLHEPPAGA